MTLKSAFADKNSSYSFNINKTNDGSYLFKIKQTNLAHLDSPEIQVTWNRDTIPPTTPTFTSPSTTSYISSNSNLNIVGVCESGSTVFLSGSDTQSTPCLLSSYHFTVTKGADGNYPFSIIQTDVAGNSSTTSQLTWTKDSSVPASPIIASPALTPYYSNGSNLTLAGSCITGHTVVVTGDHNQTLVRFVFFQLKYS